MEKDEQLAKEVQTSIETERMKAEQAKKDEIARGEREALQVAIQERKRIAAEAQARKEQEALDQEFARRSILRDVEEQHELKTLCEGDEEAAKRVHQQLQDELLAEKLQEAENQAAAQREEERKRLEKAQAAKDFEMARRTQACLDVEIQEEKTARNQEKLAVAKDFEMARRTQACIDVEIQEEKTARNQEKLAREKEDASIALKLAVAASRQEHRRLKRLNLMKSPTLFNSIEKVMSQWEQAEADVEDVAGGLCLTLLLPFLRDIRLKAIKNNTIDLEVYRIIGREEADKGLTTDENSQYCAEFVIDGRNVDISAKDLSFEYSSESGLLHVYVESVHLDQQPGDESAMLVGAATASSSGKEDIRPRPNNLDKNNASTHQSGNASGVVGKLASSFKRFFSRSHESRK